MAADQFLPREIVMEILLKLPTIKSLVGCTSVCKSWYSLIKDPYFIAKHLSHQKKIHGCCNGLICFSHDNYWLYNSNRSVYIWNPAIGKFRVVPKSVQNSDTEVLGFGFHQRINDYKLVKIGYSNRITCVPVEVEVYSLSTNSWKLITTCGPASCFVHPHELEFVSGRVYWKACSDRNCSIVSFDLINETFREILLPPELAAKQKKSLCFGALGGDSIVISSDQWSELWVYDPWDDSSKKVLSVDYRETGGLMIGFRNNGEALIHKICSPDNLQTKKGKDFGAWLSQKPYKVEPFVESLVLLNDGDARSWGVTAAGPVLEEAIHTN